MGRKWFVSDLQKRIAELNESGKMADIYKNCFNTEAGRLVLEDMKMRMYFYATSFHIDPYEHAFRAGQEAALKYILEQLTDEPSDSLAQTSDS